MTCLEKLRADHPEWGEETIAIIRSNECPHHHGLLDRPDSCGKPNMILCDDCWNREIPETEKSMVENAKADMEKDMDALAEEIVKPRILDSGNRRQFESGAVRDIQEGKGRCDLLPLDVAAICLADNIESADWTLMNIYSFQTSGQEKYLYAALSYFCDGIGRGWDIYTMLLEVAIHFEEGAKKYGDNNWRKGIPVRCYIDSGVRHYLKFLRGDNDEPHDRAFCWNIMCAIWTCRNKPELNEYGEDEYVKGSTRDSVYRAYKALVNDDDIEAAIGYLGKALE